MTARAIAEALYRGLLPELRADRLMNQAVRRAGDVLFVHDRPYRLDAYQRIFVAGAGKAAPDMARALMALLGPRVEGGLVVGQAGSEEEGGVHFLNGDHPIPGPNSFAAGAAMLDFARSTRPHDLVLFCLSGGASALMELPIESVTQDDLATTTEFLLRGGYDIRTINAARGCLSQIKGGRLGQVFEAEVACLVLSDVIGNDLSVVGSGPFFPSPPSGHPSRARSASRQPVSPRRGASDLAHRLALETEGRLPESVHRALVESPFSALPRTAEHSVIGSSAQVWPLVQAAAQSVGLTPYGYSDPLTGPAGDEAERVVNLALAKQKAAGTQPGDEPEFCLCLSGEPTVTVTGDGAGGRCQHMAMVAAGLLNGHEGIAFLAAGTDGRDGPTNSAGGCVDGHSLALAQAAGRNLQFDLQDFNSNPFLAACDGLITTGPTGTNVNDVILVVG